MWGYLVLDKWQGSEGQQWIVGLLTQHIVGVKNSTKRRIDDDRISLHQENCIVYGIHIMGECVSVDFNATQLWAVSQCPMPACDASAAINVLPKEPHDTIVATTHT